jgi:hypothetical protein
LSTLTAGSHAITAAYGGAVNYSTSTSPTLTQVVTAAPPADTTTTASSSVHPSVYGQPVTFLASVSTSGSGTPGGTVTFYDGATALGSANLSGGNATLTTSTLAAGSHAIVAVYAGTASFTGSSSAPLGQSVASASTATSLDATPKSARAGQSVTLKAAVTVAPPGGGAPAGTVNFFDGATKLNPSPIAVSSGKASFSTSFASAGTHNITAVYIAGPNFTSSTSPILGFQVK